MQPVSLTTVTLALSGECVLPPDAVLVTFDDGDRSVLTHALPALEDEGVPAAIFVIAALIGTEKAFWWTEVEEYLARGGRAAGLPSNNPDDALKALKRMPNHERLERVADLRRSAGGPPITKAQLDPEDLDHLRSSGVAIGNHTLTHPCLDQCTDEEVEREVVAAHETLEAILGEAPSTFAYPNGNFDPRAAAALSDLGYQAAFLFDHRIGPFPPHDPLRISRIRVSSTTDPDRFRILTSGLHSTIHHLLGRT